MTATTHAERMDRNRLTYIGLWALATIAFIGATVAGYPAAGAIAFFVLGGATFALGQPESMFDERDATIIEEASANTVRTIGLSSAVVFPTVSALAGLGYIQFPLWLAPIGIFVAVMFGLWGGFLLLARRHR